MNAVRLDVRKLAALDMALHGERFVLVEFAAGVAFCALMGILSLVIGIHRLAYGLSWQLILGLGLLWAALNYVPLLLHAIDLAKRGTVRQEVAVELTRPDLVRRYSLLQLWILVPFAVVAFALLQGGKIAALTPNRTNTRARGRRS